MNIVRMAAVAAFTVFALPSLAQESPTIFFEGDLVRGAGPSAKGAPCVLNSQFKRGENVIFRVRMLDPKTGKQIDEKGVKSLHVELSNGEKAPLSFHQHPPQPREATDHFWSGGFPIGENTPTGSLTYTVVATTLDGQMVKWKPFNVASSQIVVLAN